MKNSKNKEELFSLLGNISVDTITNVQVVTISGENVKGNINAQTCLIGPTCPGHEEADSRIILQYFSMEDLIYIFLIDLRFIFDREDIINNIPPFQGVHLHLAHQLTNPRCSQNLEFNSLKLS